MSLKQLEEKVMELPPDERREFALWFYDHEQKIVGAPDTDTISPEVKAELLRRRDDLRANPGLAVPVTDEWFDNLKKKLSSVRPSKASAA